jgi:rubrerythrin
MSNTKDNLEAAFAGESQANRKYLFFARKADKEGQGRVARLFRAAAEAETVHALNHFAELGGIGTTRDNLTAAIGGEKYEFTEMYPAFIEQAKADGVTTAERSFSQANEVEEIHHGLFTEALKALEAGEQLSDEPYYVCQVCGNTVLKEAPERCPICGTPRSGFKQVD